MTVAATKPRKHADSRRRGIPVSALTAGKLALEPFMLRFSSADCVRKSTAVEANPGGVFRNPVTITLGNAYWCRNKFSRSSNRRARHAEAKAASVLNSAWSVLDLPAGNVIRLSPTLPDSTQTMR